ncbi:hypothetical protein ACS0TY_021678 [Phlomoides rotata]
MLPFLSLAAPLTSRVAAALCTLPLCCRRLLNPLRAHMFTNDQRQKERTGKSGTLRLQYLQELVAQFQNASSEEIKEKIVANLGNFAYDPYNYTFFCQLNVLELFLDCLTEPNEKLVEFAVGGICNACANPTNAAVIIQCDGLLSSNAYQVLLGTRSFYKYDLLLSDVGQTNNVLNPMWDKLKCLHMWLVEASRLIDSLLVLDMKICSSSEVLLGEPILELGRPRRQAIRPAGELVSMWASMEDIWGLDEPFGRVASPSIVTAAVGAHHSDGRLPRLRFQPKLTQPSAAPICPTAATALRASHVAPSPLAAMPT